MCKLCVRHCAKQGDCNGEQESDNSCSNDLVFSRENGNTEEAMTYSEECGEEI